MSHPRLVLFSTLLFAALGFCPSAPLRAQTNYESYTFLTFVGPTESPGWYDGTNSAVGFAYPFGAAVDKTGNVYVADTYNHTIRKISPAGAVTTLAGSAGNYGTNDGVGYAARFLTPDGLAVDTNGNVFVADTGNHTIRKITPAGLVTTLAGSPTQSGTNDGAGPAARFYNPTGVAVDTNGNLFVADWDNHTIRVVTPAGAVSTVAGLAGVSGTNNGTGSAARFYHPAGVAVGTNSTVYVTDQYNHTIRKISPAGVVTNLAGLAEKAGTNNGAGSAARFNYPVGVAVETNGNLLIADYVNQTLRRVTAAGVVTNVAGLAGVAGSADGAGSTARFNNPTGVAADTAGNAYVADYFNQLIRKVSSSAVVSTLAGKPGGPGTNNGSGAVVRFNTPRSVAVDGSGNVYVADSSNHTIRKSTPAGAVTNLAGLATVSGTNNGMGSTARFNTPYGLAVDTNGNVYVADTFNDTIRKVSSAGGVTIFAGSLTVSGTNDGTGTAARFFRPTSVATDRSGTIYVADTANSTIRKITPAGVVTTVAGLATVEGTNDGVVTAARFNFPYGVAVDANTNVYVADSFNRTIRKITPAGLVTTLAGSAGIPGYTDGVGFAAQFNFPVGIGVDTNGNVYVTENTDPVTGVGYHTIRKITPGGLVTTLAGTPLEASSINGSGATARFNSPGGLAVATDGTVYVADSSNHTVRKGYPAPTDVPVVDLPWGKPGVIRQMDVTNLTTTSWSWSIVRYPAGALSQLSSTTNRNPTFTPDLSEMYAIRFQGTNASGRFAIGILELVGSGVIEPKINSIRMSATDVVLTGTGGAPGAGYSVLSTSNLWLPTSSWMVLPGSQFDNNGRFAFTNTLSGSRQVYRLRVP